MLLTRLKQAKGSRARGMYIPQPDYSVAVHKLGSSLVIRTQHIQARVRAPEHRAGSFGLKKVFPICSSLIRIVDDKIRSYLSILSYDR